MTKFEAI